MGKLALSCQRPLRNYICGTDSKDKREIFLLPGAYSVSKAFYPQGQAISEVLSFNNRYGDEEFTIINTFSVLKEDGEGGRKKATDRLI